MAHHSVLRPYAQGNVKKCPTDQQASVCDGIVDKRIFIIDEHTQQLSDMS